MRWFDWGRIVALPVNVSLLETARNQALNRLGDSWIEGIYSVALIAGTNGLATFLGDIPGISHLWGSGDKARAIRLVELWTALVAQVSLGDQADQDAVAKGVARSFATLFLKADEGALLWFLHRFHVQLAQYLANPNLGTASWVATLLYWRSSEILGQKSRLTELTFPVIDSVETLVARGFAFPPLEDVMGTFELFMSSCRTADEARR